jgi:hypothetical protein
MAEIPPSTPQPDAAAAQTRRGSARRQAGRRPSSSPIAFNFGDSLLPAENAPERRRRLKSDPLYRPLHIFALDPTQPKLDGKVAVVNVPWEPLEPGPVGRWFEVETVDPTQTEVTRLDLQDARLLLERGIRPTTSDGRFHRQMVYAVCSSVHNAFFRALGRDLSWGFHTRERLLLRPFAFEGKNAFYDPVAGELKFGFFTVKYSETASDTVYTSLSHDIVAHELTHALLDGLRRNFTLPTNPDVLAFHEAFGDLVAIFHHFSYPEIVRAAIRDSRGDLGVQTILSGIARQFGEGMGKHGVLRTAIDFSEGVPQKKYGDVTEPHDLGAVLVAAVFDTFTRVFKRKTERLLRIAGRPAGNLPHELETQLADEASKIASQFLVICIRAVDYCPPVDITFGEFLRAVITADRDLVPDDPWAYREAWLDSFRLRQIFPDNVRHMSEDAIEWKRPGTDVTIADLNFAALNFSGDPAHVVSRDEMARQANSLGNTICRRDLLDDFGLVASGDRDLNGDVVEPPRIESIRSSRRIGPDGQIAFDLVAEVTQRRIVDRDGKVFPFYGGTTIIIGPDGDVRYVIGKSVKNNTRVDAQAKFISKSSGLWGLQGREYKPEPQPFMLLHAEWERMNSTPAG